MAYLGVPYRPEQHRAALEALWRNSFDPKVDASRIAPRTEWLYRANPEGAATTFVVTLDESGEAVGCATYLPRAVVVHGERMRSGVLCDFAVDKQHRIAGAAIAVQRALAKSSWSSGHRFLYGFPNAASVAVCKRVGYKAVGATETWVKPLRSGAKIRFERAPFAEKPAAAVVDAGLAVFDRALSGLFGRAFEGEALATPDARFDSLWERARPGRGVAGERTRAYLAWRYEHFPTTRHRFYCLTRDGGREIAGYAAYSIDEGRAILQDLFAEDYEETTDALLSRLSVHLRGEGATALVLSFLGSPLFAERLKRLGFFKRVGDRIMVAYVDPALEESTRRAVLDPASWFILDGELDI
jgi:hypothetical protein